MKADFEITSTRLISLEDLLQYANVLTAEHDALQADPNLTDNQRDRYSAACMNTRDAVLVVISKFFLQGDPSDAETLATLSYSYDFDPELYADERAERTGKGPLEMPLPACGSDAALPFAN